VDNFVPCRTLSPVISPLTRAENPRKKYSRADYLGNQSVFFQRFPIGLRRMHLVNE